MNKQVKKALSAVLSLAMVAGSIVLPAATAGAAAATFDANATLWKFDFGAADSVADGYIGVSADTEYSSATGYGLLGLTNGFALDDREDGWRMTQGYDLQLENGKKATVATADDDWVATTTRTEKDQPYNSPIRFSMKVTGNTYYTVTVKLRRADVAKAANVSLFTEKRHQHLLDYPIPEEGMTYTTNVYVHNNWSKNTGEYNDTQLSVAAAGDNVAISAIEVEKKEQGKTFWILGDSTVCQQTAGIPYWPLDHCQGVGSAMPKYVSEEWALVNEAESGLSASSSKSHFNNMKNDIKEGDVVWFEFGHNDDKVTNDPSTNGYLSTLAEFYNTITAAGADLIVASPIQRDTAGQYNDSAEAGSKWKASLAQYGTAASAFVEEQIAAGKTNIAYIDLNTASLDFLNEVQTDIDAVRAAASLESLKANTTRFYYYVSKYAGYTQDYTHPNDYGADNFAKISIDEAKAKITAAVDASATDSQKKQAAVFSKIFGNDTRNYEAVRVADEVVLAGAPANSFYPNQLAKVVLYEYPLLVNSVTFDSETNKPSKMKVKLVASELEYKYGRGVIEIYNSEGTLKGTVKTTTESVDSVAAETQEITFDTSDVSFDAAAGDTFRAYVNRLNETTFEEENVRISTIYTQDDMVDIKDYLLQGALGTENKEDFSSYGLVEGDTLVGVNNWKDPANQSTYFTYGKEDDLSFAHCATDGNGTFYPEKSFTAVNSGQLYCRFDVRYVTGTFNLYFTDGTAMNSWPAGRILPVAIKTDSGEVKVFLDNKAVASINSGEWITYALTIDFDYGKYYLKVNGETYEADFSPYNTSQTPLVPSKLSLLSFQNDKSTNEYDVTNIVLATLNTPELPNKTLAVSANNDDYGTVSIQNGEEAVEGKTLSTAMNTVVTAVAEAKRGYTFKQWVDADTNEVASYALSYPMRLHDNTNLKAEFEEAEFDPITHAYYEPFSTFSTATLAAGGWSGPNYAPTIESDTTHGNYLSFAPGQNNDRNVKGVFPDDAKLTKDYVIEFDAAIKPGNNHATDMVVYTDGATIANNSHVDSGYILKLYNEAADSTTYTINGGTNSVTIPSGTWVHFFAKVNVTDKTVDVQITNGNEVLYKGTETINGDETKLGGLNFDAGRYQATFKLDNIDVYTADQVTDAEVKITTPAVKDGTLTFTISNDTGSDYNTGSIVVASYNENGTLKGVDIKDAVSVAASRYPGVAGYGNSQTVTANVTSDNWKVMFWDGVDTMKPVGDVIVPAPAADPVPEPAPTE